MTEMGGKLQAASYKAISSGAVWMLSFYRHGQRQGEWVTPRSLLVADGVKQPPAGWGQPATTDAPDYEKHMSAGPGTLALCAITTAVPLGACNSPWGLSNGDVPIATHHALELQP